MMTTRRILAAAVLAAMFLPARAMAQESGGMVRGDGPGARSPPQRGLRNPNAG